MPERRTQLMTWRSFVLRFVAATVVSICFLWFRREDFLNLEEVDSLIETNATFADAFHSNTLDKATSSYDVDAHAYVWGRTTTPQFSMDLYNVNAALRYLQMKEFVWLSVTSGDWLVGVAVLQFHYMSTLTVQVLRVAKEDAGSGRAGPSTVYSLRGRLDVPLVSDLTQTGGVWIANGEGRMGPAAPGHTVLFRPPVWSRSPSFVNLTFTGNTIELAARAVVADAPRQFGGGSRSAKVTREYVVEINATVQRPATWMGLVFPLGPKRPALVQKMAAVPLASPAQLTIYPRGGTSSDVGGTALALRNGQFAMDYTRGVLRRFTQWYWASVSTPSGIGLHLSANTYDVHNVSVESSVFDARQGAENTVTFLNEAVSFVRLPTTHKVQWAIRSSKGAVSLVFTSHGGHDGEVNARVVNVNLNHQWGTFRGKVRVGDDVVVLEDVPGVFEEHVALW